MPRRYTIGDHKVRAFITGHGTPAVIFETFGPAPLEFWNQIQTAVSAGVMTGWDLPMDPQIVAIAEDAAARGRPIYLAVPQRAPLLHEVAARHPLIAEAITVDTGAYGGIDEAAAELAQHFPDGFDFIAGDRAANAAPLEAFLAWRPADPSAAGSAAPDRSYTAP